MGRRHYEEFASPEIAIYEDIVETLKTNEDLNRISWYFYDYDNDDDIEDEVPPDGKIPAIRIAASSQDRTDYSSELDETTLGLDVECWIDGNHVGDAWGIRNAIYRALKLHRVRDVFSTPWVVGITPGEIEHIARGLMKSVQTVQINYFMEHPRR